MKTLIALLLVTMASNFSLAADGGYGYSSKSSTRTPEQNKLITPDDDKGSNTGYNKSPRAKNVHEDDWHDSMSRAPTTKTHNEPDKFKSHVPSEQE